MTQHSPTPLALCLFTTRFAALVEEGFSLVRTFSLLEDVPEPYGEDAKRLRNLVESGDSISHAMSERPDLYSSYYVHMIRAGEVGGILDVLLRRSADMITKECQFMNRWSHQETAFFFASPSTQAQPESWEDLSQYQRTVIQLLFCETLGTILGSGVPILRSLGVVRWLLPKVQAERLDEAKEGIAAGERMNPGRLGLLPACIVALIDAGEEAGTLNSTLLRCAEILETELDLRVAQAAV